MQRICVYCGSNTGRNPAYVTAAVDLGDALVDRGIELVYGGASKGIMGIIADRVLERGGSVHGVIPQQLVDKEVAHNSLTKMHVVGSMHERKMLMAALSDAFVALPGGFGTLEEIIEIVTWGQLRFHDKPCGLLNAEGYYDPLLGFLDHAEAEGFVRGVNRRMLLSDANVNGLLGQFDRYEAPTVNKWVS